jgi:hypothetical protein
MIFIRDSPRGAGAGPPGCGGTPAVHPARAPRGAPATPRRASATWPPPINPTAEMVWCRICSPLCARLEQEPRREEDSALGADIEERPSQPLQVGRSMAPRGPLAGVIVCRPPVSSYAVPSGSCSRKAAASVCLNTRARAGREHTGT